MKPLPDPSHNPLPAALRHRRRRLGLTQQELAKLTGISPCTISLLECGQCTGRFFSALVLLDALGLRLVIQPKEVAK